MADMFLRPIIEKLIEKIDEEIICATFRYVKYQFRWKKHAKEELEKLKGVLPKIEAIVHFASSQAQITEEYPALNEWLWQLRDAIDDAKDVLDELEYMELEKQVTKNKKLRRVRSIMKSVKKRFVIIVKRAFNIDPTLKRLEEAVQKLVQASTTAVDTFYHLVKDAKQELQLDLYEARETGSLPKNDFIGRAKEKELVLEWLRNPSNEPHGTDLYRNISLLSIVGHGGMGKTALLQHVYEDEEITKEFDPQMWVCVSNNFDAKKVIADMLECLMKERPRLETLVALQGALKKEVMSKKFLLVLDDIWEDDEEKDKRKWEDVLAPLASGSFGSKIMVTTRMDSVALMFIKIIKKKKEIIKLEGLEEDECLQLLNSHAFAGVENPYHDDYKKLRDISGEVVKKLLRSPLAAKVIGGVLNNNLDERHWRIVLKSNLLDQNSIMSILKLSYIVLPNYLRNCFAICCMFPQDHDYDKDDLIRMWIALGFIHSSQGMTKEDIGGRYFDVLVKKSLFDKVRNDYKEEYYYKMHDLIHESASNFFAHECDKFVGNYEKSFVEISDTIRHLSVRTTNPDILRQIEKFKHLQSLLSIYEASNQDLCSSLIEIFTASTSLRVLYIRIDNLKKIPEEIKYLKHLRYLNIKNIEVTMLPRFLNNLYHLQYLSIPGFLQADCFSICEIGKLRCLREVHMFNLRNEMGYRIEELKYLNDLCKLGINCLENVKDAKEARNVQLCKKRGLTDLTLCWSTTDLRNIDLDENVLDNLLPPECLRNLTIERYIGARSAEWMNDVNMISNLEKIELSYCGEWETLPPFGQLPFLKSLELVNMPKVKWLENKINGNDKYGAFPLLEKLYIKDLEALEDWFEGGVPVEDGCLFPCLIQLDLLRCPKLKELPSLPRKLKTLKIMKVGWKTLNFYSNSNPIPLATLEVHNCPNMTSIPLADEIARLAALRQLQIEECPNLISLGEMPTTTSNCHHLILNSLRISDPSVLLMEPLRTNIASLKNLTIEHNDSVVSFPKEVDEWFLNVNVRYSLSNLRFQFLGSLLFLPFSLKSLSSLHTLFIWGVPMLLELPNLPPSLQSLYIVRVHLLQELPNLPLSLKTLSIVDVSMLRDLPNLPPSLINLQILGECHPELAERYGEDEGSDRHKIAHIPDVDICLQ